MTSAGIASHEIGCSAASGVKSARYDEELTPPQSLDGRMRAEPPAASTPETEAEVDLMDLFDQLAACNTSKPADPLPQSPPTVESPAESSLADATAGEPTRQAAEAPRSTRAEATEDEMAPVISKSEVEPAGQLLISKSEVLSAFDVELDRSIDAALAEEIETTIADIRMMDLMESKRSERDLRRSAKALGEAKWAYDLRYGCAQGRQGRDAEGNLMPAFVDYATARLSYRSPAPVRQRLLVAEIPDEQWNTIDPEIRRNLSLLIHIARTQLDQESILEINRVFAEHGPQGVILELQAAPAVEAEELTPSAEAESEGQPEAAEGTSEQTDQTEEAGERPKKQRRQVRVLKSSGLRPVEVDVSYAISIGDSRGKVVWDTLAEPLMLMDVRLGTAEESREQAPAPPPPETQPSDSTRTKTIIGAVKHLGFRASDATKAVESIQDEIRDLSLEDAIRRVLLLLSTRASRKITP
jgi:hypothetical protein